MTKDELIVRLKEQLDECDSRITEAELYAKDGVNGVEPIVFRVQIDMLVTVCIWLEALIEEAQR